MIFYPSSKRAIAMLCFNDHHGNLKTTRCNVLLSGYLHDVVSYHCSQKSVNYYVIIHLTTLSTVLEKLNFNTRSYSQRNFRLLFETYISLLCLLEPEETSPHHISSISILILSDEIN